MDSYFVSRKRSYSSLGDADSVTTRSASSDADVHFSDMDSETSKETVNEKQNSEDREKEPEEEEVDGEKEVAIEKDSHMIFEPDKKRRMSDTGRNFESRKRCSESSDNVNGEVNFADGDLPRKKRPHSSGSNILDDSIHMPDQSGMDLNTLVDHVKSLKRKGMYSEYASIKMEAPCGTFHVSK